MIRFVTKAVVVSQTLGIEDSREKISGFRKRVEDTLALIVPHVLAIHGSDAILRHGGLAPRNKSLKPTLGRPACSGECER